MAGSIGLLTFSGGIERTQFFAELENPSSARVMRIATIMRD
jgi:hypothetical protein